MGCMDLTGIFPHNSASGHEYLLFGYNYDANAILVVPSKNCQEKTITDRWENINQHSATAVVKPHTYVIDNEVTNALKREFEKYTVNYQLVPPHLHRAKKSERAFHTFKDYFKAGLATVYPYLPISSWDLLLTQAVTTLNIL